MTYDLDPVCEFYIQSQNKWHKHILHTKKNRV